MKRVSKAEKLAKNRERVRRWRAKHRASAKAQSKEANERYQARKRGRPRLEEPTSLRSQRNEQAIGQ